MYLSGAGRSSSGAAAFAGRTLGRRTVQCSSLAEARVLAAEFRARRKR